MFINWIRNLFTTTELFVLGLVVYMIFIAALIMFNAVDQCGSQGYGPAARQTC